MEEEINNKIKKNNEDIKNNTTKTDNFEKAGQIQNEVGSQSLQTLGVENKNLTEKNVQSNGEKFSPFNTIADRNLKQKGQQMLANNLNHFVNNKQKNNNQYNPFDKIKKNKFNQLNDYRNRSNNNGQNVEEKDQNVIDKAATQAIEKGGSAAMQAAGIPKPVADVVSKKIAGPVLEKSKKILKIKIAISLLPIFLIIIIFIGLGGETAADEEAKEIAKSGEINNYLYGSGSETNLYQKLIEMGLCKTNEECANTQAAKFYIELKKKISNYDDTTKKIAANFIIEMTRYNRYDTSTGGRKGRYDTIDEIEYLGNIILADGSLTTTSIKSYKSKIIEDGGYFETYRPELLKKDKDNSKLKSEIFDKVVESTIDIVNSITSSITLNNGGACTYQVSGTEYSNIKIQLTECGSLNKPIDGGELIDLEKYILGVVYQENGNAPDEGLKAQAIAARSYTLLRRKIEIIDGQAVIKMRNCTFDQVYCDPDKGCSSNVLGGQTTSGGNNSLATVYSGVDASKKWTKQPLDVNANLRKVVNEVAGMVAVNENGDVLYTDYASSAQESWNKMASQGYDYVSILKQHYKNKNNYDLSITSKCTNLYASGDFTSWKQCDDTWGSVKLGNSDSTICRAGCLATSVAIQLAKSGVTTNLSDLNPGTFVQALSQSNGFSGAEFTWNISSVTSNFVLVEKNYTLTGTKSEKANQLKNLLDSGYYVVIRAKENQHWVALDRVEGETVYIHDPGSQATTLWDKYTDEAGINRCAYFKIVQ